MNSTPLSPSGSGPMYAFTDGVEQRIDVAEVNGRLFLNNVSLGIYGDAVREPGYRDGKAAERPRESRAVWPGDRYPPAIPSLCRSPPRT